MGIEFKVKLASIPICFKENYTMDFWFGLALVQIPFTIGGVWIIGQSIYDKA